MFEKEKNFSAGNENKGFYNVINLRGMNRVDIADDKDGADITLWEKSGHIFAATICHDGVDAKVTFRGTKVDTFDILDSNTVKDTYHATEYTSGFGRTIQICGDEEAEMLAETKATKEEWIMSHVLKHVDENRIG